MPAKKEERGAEIDSCSLKISEEKIKILLYAWEKVYTYGDAESMCTDGIILNRYRQEILHVKSHLEANCLMQSQRKCQKNIWHRLKQFGHRHRKRRKFILLQMITDT